MTNEEAIEYLNTLYMALAVFPNQQISLGNVDEMKESVSMAIQTLSQEPYICDTCKNKENGWDTEPCDGCCGNHSGYEPCEDAISRAEAQTALMMSKDAYLFIGHPTIRISDAVQAIRELPSVRPQEPYDEIMKLQTYKMFEGEDTVYVRRDDILELLEQERKTGHCRDCKYFEYDSVAKVDGVSLIVAHEICSKWGDGCKTKEDGYCYLYEPQESEG